MSRSPDVRRIAAIDVGTNTALLLVADLGADGRLEVVHDEERFVRLGEGVDATGRVGEGAMERARTALLAHRATAERLGAERIVVGATSASRDARNRAELVGFIERETGLRYRILSGDEEARLSFRGALSAFPNRGEPRVVIDIGGGSTEVVVGTASGGIRFRRSLDVGSVRLTERFFRSSPPAQAAIDEAERWIEGLCAELPVERGVPLIGASGTSTTVAFLHHPERLADWPRVGPIRLAAADVRVWRERLLGMTVEEVLALNPSLMTGRADVFPAGALILDVFMRRLGHAFLDATTRNLRYGLALEAGTAA